MFKISVNDNYKYPFKGMKEIKKSIPVEDYSIELIL